MCTLIRPTALARNYTRFYTQACLLLILFCTLMPAAQAAEENRCGWFSNPTPNNAWLIDRDGEWTISEQGGHQAEGDWPEFKKRDWTVSNAGEHGYGCACMRVTTDRAQMRILTIKSAQARPLAACRKDRKLKAP